MGRRSATDQLLDMVDTHPALRAKPMATRFLWLALARLMRGAGVAVLRFGSTPVPLNEVALMLAISVTELQTHLEPLLASELLTREPDGALGCPFLAKLISRAEINRANGLKGGRPRKAPPDAGQSSMLLPIAGGAADAGAQTERKPKPGGRYNAKLASYSEPLIQQARDVAVQAKALAAIEADPTPDEIALVCEWQQQGASEAAILRVVERRKRDGLNSLFYFREAMQALLGPTLASMPMASSDAAPLPARNPAFQAAYEAWRAGGYVGAVPNPRDFVAAA